MLQKKSMTHTIKSLIALGFVLNFVSNSYAVNMQYLRYSPVASFTAEDFELLQKTGINALNNNKDGIISEWKNPESQNSGSITPIETSTIDDNHCRKTQIINHSKKQHGKSVFTFCKIKERWKLLK